VDSWTSSDSPATAAHPGWLASGAATIRMLSSSTVPVTEIRPCRARFSWLAVTSGIVPASALAPRTRPAGSITWIT